MGKTEIRKFFTISFRNEFRKTINKFGGMFGNVSNTTMNLANVADKLYDEKPDLFWELLEKTK